MRSCRRQRYQPSATNAEETPRQRPGSPPNPIEGESDIEIRPVFEAEDFGPELTSELKALEGVDCVVRGGSGIDESLVARRLGHTRMVTCASPQYLREFGAPLTPKDLERHHVMNYVPPRSGKTVPFKYIDGSDA